MLQVRINLTWFDSQFPLSSNHNYSESMNNLILTSNIYEVQCFSKLGGGGNLWPEVCLAGFFVGI